MTNKSRTKSCSSCGGVFVEHRSDSEKQWECRSFCSYSCSSAKERTPLVERFWSKVDVAGADECWTWKGSKDRRGYGRIGLGSRSQGNIKSHRLAVQLDKGIELRPADIVCHTCDNPSCVNPSHLVVADQRENMLQASQRGRLSPVSLLNLNFNHKAIS